MMHAKRIKRESAAIAMGVVLPWVLVVLAEAGVLDRRSADPALVGSALVGVSALAAWGMLRLLQIRAYATERPKVRHR